MRAPLLLAASSALLACGGPARVEVDPASVQLFVQGQSARVKAVALAGSGKALPEKPCKWSAGDAAVVSLAARGNEATVTAVGPGSTAVRCQVGSVAGEVAVSVRVVAKVEVTPAVAALKLRDQPEPTALSVRAIDDKGQQIAPRTLVTRCLDENVCRGDDRGQLWPVGAGSSPVLVEADGASTRIEARVEDARTAAGKPRAVTGNPMLEYEKAYQILEKERQKKAAGAK